MKSYRMLAAAFLVSTLTLAASEPIKQRVIVRDGKVEVFEAGPGMVFIDPAHRGYLGVLLMDLTPELRAHFGGPREAAVIVAGVRDDSPAAKGGIQVGDVITAIDGNKVTVVPDVGRFVGPKKSGETARVDIERRGARQTVVLNVTERKMPDIRLPKGDLIPSENLERLERHFNSPEFKARVAQLGDCSELQTRIKELEGRLKELEKKLK